jgi:hypothetical protein
MPSGGEPSNVVEDSTERIMQFFNPEAYVCGVEIAFNSD